VLIDVEVLNLADVQSLIDDLEGKVVEP